MSKTIIQELLKPTEFKYIGAEKEFEDYLYESIDEVAFYCGWGKVKRIEKQYILKYGKKKPRVDLMVWHNDGSGTIIECKIENSNHWMLSAIGQSLFYRNIAKHLLGQFPRIVIAADSIPTELYSVIAEYKLPIKLLQMDNGKIIYV